jgi:DNA protecting protein DprA
MKIIKLNLEETRLPIDFYQINPPANTLYLQTLDEMSSDEAIALLSLLPQKGLAVVGTRMPQQRSIQEVHKVISSLRSSDLIIVSGFAIGIDTAAHEAALTAKLKTIAFLAGGVNQLYPHNIVLRDRIIDGGGMIISEYEPDHHPEPKNFLCRNRLIGGWTRATWIVEASYRSGALNTARWARENHHTVYATPCYPGEPSLAGNQKLIDHHQAKALWSAKDLGEEWIGLTSLIMKKEKNMTDKLVLELKKMIQRNQSVSFSEMKSWSLKRGWTMDKFLTALQRV